MSFSKYPNQIDTSTELPVTIDLQTPVNAEVVNRLRDAVLSVEGELGILPRGVFGTVRERLDKIDVGISTVSVNVGTIEKVLDEGSLVRSNVRELNFIGPATVASSAVQPDRVDITITASGSGGTSIFQEQETITVLTNGQTAFTITSTPQDDSAVEMYVNGFKQEFDTDYTAVGTAITYSGALSLITTDIVEFWYIAVGGDIISQEQETIAVTFLGQTAFTLSSVPIDPTAVKMFVNGQKQENAIDYTIVSNAVTYSGPITLDTPDIVEFWYVISGLASGGGGGGGGEGLAQTLDISNITDGYNIIISDGDLIIGQTGVASLDGVNADIRGGPSTGSGDGGAALLSGGTASGTGDGGNTTIVSGNSSAGSAGNIAISSGTGPTAAGDITLTTGSTSGAGADIVLDLTNAGSSADGYIRFQEDGVTFLEFTSGSAKIISPSDMIFHANGISVLTLDGDGGTSPIARFNADTVVVNGTSIVFDASVAGQFGQSSTSGENANQLIVSSQAVTGGGDFSGGDLVIHAGVGQGTLNDGYVLITDAGGVDEIVKIVSDPQEVIIDGKLTVTGLIDPTGLVLDEQAAGFGATNTAAGKGIIWVDNSTAPNRLIFTDESGADSVLGGIGAGNETLGQTLSLGNTTDGYDVVFSDGDDLTTTRTSNDFNINFTNTVAGNAYGINITGQNSSDAFGGAISITSGDNVGTAEGPANGGPISITAGNTVTSGGDGGIISLQAGTATVGSSNGGDIQIYSGAANNAGIDGNIVLAASEDSSASSLNGRITFNGLVSGTPTSYMSVYRDNTDSGNAIIEFAISAVSPIIRQATHTTAAGSDLSIKAQNTTFSSTNGGNLLLDGGDSSGGTDGYVRVLTNAYIDDTLTIGTASTGLFIDPAAGQQILIGETHGNVLWGFAGDSAITGATWTFDGQNSTGAGSAGGDIFFFAGSGNELNTNGAELIMRGGSASVNGGAFQINAGDGYDTGAGGNIIIQSGAAGSSSGDGGDFTFTAADGVASGGAGGNFTFTSGDGDGNGGGASFFLGSCGIGEVSAGDFVVTGGTNGGDAQSDASNITMTAGTGSGGGDPGIVTIRSGSGSGGTSVGGVASFLGGTGLSGSDAGVVLIQGGEAFSTGTGGDTNILGGDAVVNSGNVSIAGGGRTSGNPSIAGSVTIAAQGGSVNDGSINVNLITQVSDGYIRLQVDGVDSFTMDTNNLFFVADTLLVPSLDPVGGGYMYVEAGAGKWHGGSGTVTTFGPAEPHCPRCGRDFALEAVNDNEGWSAAICVPCLVNTLDKAGISRDDYMIHEAGLK